MSAETVALHMRAVVSLDDLAAMNAADGKGHRYESSPEGVLVVMLGRDGRYERTAQMPLTWLLNTAPSTHLG